MPFHTPQQPMGSFPMQFGNTRVTRPIGKRLIYITLGTISTQTNSVLITNTFPCTITGLRVEMKVLQDGGTAPGEYSWAIVIVKQGQTVPLFGTGNLSNFFVPETNVMLFGAGAHSRADGNNSGTHYDNATKTMRKMQGGDTLQFICIGKATNTSRFTGCIQFFCKT